jgi:hypothetical protein
MKSLKKTLLKKSLKKILIVTLIASSGVAASGGMAEAQAPRPVKEVVISTPADDGPAGPVLMSRSGIRW